MWDIYLHFILALAALTIWGTSYRYLRTELKMLGYILFITLLFEGYSLYLMLQGIRNLYLFHILTPLQYALYSVLFYLVIREKRARRLILITIPLGVLASALITLFIQPPSEFNSYASSLKNILISCWVLLYYRDVFTQLNVIKLDREPMFWVSTGLFFNSLGSFFLFGLMNDLLEQSYELAHLLYYFSEFLGYVLFLTFAIAFLLNRKTTILQLNENN